MVVLFNLSSSVALVAFSVFIVYVVCLVANEFLHRGLIKLSECKLLALACGI